MRKDGVMIAGGSDARFRNRCKRGAPVCYQSAIAMCLTRIDMVESRLWLRVHRGYDMLNRSYTCTQSSCMSRASSEDTLR